MSLNEKRDFQYARKARDKAIQQDIFFDFKKLIFCYLGVGGIFLCLSITAILVSGEIKNIFLILLALISIVIVVSGFVIANKIKRREMKYRKQGEETIKKAEQR